MKDNSQKIQEVERLQESVNLGEEVKQFLDSKIWQIISGYIADCIKGLNDISSIEITSEKKVLAEVIARKNNINYLQGIEAYLRGLIDEGEHALDRLQALAGKKEIVVRQ